MFCVQPCSLTHHTVLPFSGGFIQEQTRVLHFSHLTFPISPFLLTPSFTVDETSLSLLSYSVAYSTTISKIDNDFSVISTDAPHPQSPLEMRLELGLRDGILPVLLFRVINLVLSVSQPSVGFGVPHTSQREAGNICLFL